VRLLATYTVNRLGDHVGIVALALLVYDQTGDALAVSGLFVAMEFLPAFAAPALVARVDQAPFRRVLPALYVAEAALFAALAVLADDFSLPVVLALAFLDGLCMLAARGLTRAAINAVLEPAGQLRAGNGLVNVGFAVAGVLGAATGGALVEWLGVSAALALDAGSFLIAGIVLAGARELPGGAVERERFLARWRAGFSFAWRTPLLRLLLTGEALALILFTLIVPIEVLYARETLDTNAFGYGVLLSSWGAGLTLGSLAYLRLKERPPVALLFFATLLIAAAYLGMGIGRELWIACALSVLGGFGNGIQWVALVTAVQEATPADLQARVVGLLESVASAATGIGFVLGGVLVAATEPPTAFLVSGAGLLALVLLTAVALRGRGAELRPPRPPGAPSGAA
jgi:predicted MFS family arabinose efflux permease